MFVKSMSTH